MLMAMLPVTTMSFLHVLVVVGILEGQVIVKRPFIVMSIIFKSGLVMLMLCRCSRA